MRSACWRSDFYNSTLSPSATFEAWLSRNVETVAAPSVARAVGDKRLSPNDWRNLALLYAALSLRTERGYLETMKVLGDSEGTIRESVQRTTQRLLSQGCCPLSPDDSAAAATGIFAQHPIRVRFIEGEDGAQDQIEAEILVGRHYWHEEMKRLLTDSLPIRHLYSLRWSVLRPAPGFRWIVGDQPAVRIGFSPPMMIDHRVGWGTLGAELMLPLSPQHLLYSQVGFRPPRRGSQLNREATEIVTRALAQGSNQEVFANTSDVPIERFRKRIVDHAAFEEVKKARKRWAELQRHAEGRF